MMTKRVVVGLAVLLMAIAAVPVTAAGDSDDGDGEGGRGQDCYRAAGHKACLAVDEPRCGLGFDVDGFRYCVLPRLGGVV